MRFLSESIFNAMLLMLSGYAFADGHSIDPPKEMSIANNAHPSVTVVRPAEPQSYLQRFETEYQAAQGKPFYAQVKNLYNALLTHQLSLGGGETMPTSATQPQASSYFSTSVSMAPQLTLVQSPNATSLVGSRPQRRLALVISDWTFSGSARITNTDNKSATLTVRRRF